MSKKIFLSLTGLLAIMLFLTGCSKQTNESIKEEIETYFKDLNITYISEKTEGDSVEMTFQYNNITFLANSYYDVNGGGGLGTTTKSTTILYETYKYHMAEINAIAIKYGLIIEKVDSKFVVKATTNQLNNVHGFSADVVNISDINKIYQLKVDRSACPGCSSSYDDLMIGETSFNIEIHNKYGEVISTFTLFAEMTLNKTEDITE